jgi:adenine-specific DNA-methyltransferase
MDKLKMRSPNLTEGNIAKLAALFPNCGTESHDEKGELKRSIDFDQLRQELSSAIVEGPRERYHLNWPGKREALLVANAPITKTLRPCREESVDFDTTQNLFIEGDNLDVLKLLQETYLGKVNTICIDPPYNTGNDFIYKDNFTADKERYDIESGLRDEEGNKLIDEEKYKRNLRSNGRFHSDWLSMMYPRLKLARNLLKDDGVIFISIDDNEVHNLRKMCDEVFGEDNFIADLIWTNKEGGGSSDSKYFRIKHEHIICYAKDLINVEILGVPISNRERYALSDEFEKERGPYYLQKLGMGSIQYSESLDYEITAPDGKIITPKNNNKGKRACWRWSKKKFLWGIENGFIEIKKDSSDIWTVYSKQYLKCDNKGNHIYRTQRPFGVIDTFSSTQASKYLDSIGIGSCFSYSKPIELISYISERISKKDDIILDFFAGSCTTAHAVIQRNAEDGSNCKFIMVQLPEPCDEKSEAYKTGYKTIAEIGKERIRRVGKKIKKENANKEGIENLDTGFRVLKIDSSNMADVYYTPDAVEQKSLFLSMDNIKPDRTAEDLLFQVLLDWGVDLSLPVTKEIIADKEVFFVDGNALAACFVKNGGITEDFVKELAKRKPLRVVFRDAGFKDDSVKINVEQIFKLMSPHTEVKTI